MRYLPLLLLLALAGCQSPSGMDAIWDRYFGQRQVAPVPAGAVVESTNASYVPPSDNLPVEIVEIKPIPAGSAWEAKAGGTLRTTIQEWAESARWTVVWDSKHDFRIRAAATFTGTFEQATAKAVETFIKAGARPAPRATLYRGNQTVVITTAEDEETHAQKN